MSECSWFRLLAWWFDDDKSEFERRNVLFQMDDRPTYIRKMMENVLSSEDECQ